MNIFKRKINDIFEKLKFKENAIDRCDSIVFINRPIENSADDLIGFDIHVKSIKDAINCGANSIGVISDFGTGKSSLTELIGIEDEEYCKPIKVNLWDCLIDGIESQPSGNGDCNSDMGIKVLTKSFLFQLASGDKNSKLANHINKRLSKNYGTLSFSITSRAFWRWIIFSAFCYCLFSISELIPFNFQTEELINITENIMWFFEFIIYIRPLFLIASIACAIMGIRNADIAFSLWDSQGKRNPEINDVFDIYLYIIGKLSKDRKGKRQLIIIEDLDRITDKKCTIGFLSEIYRFNNLLSTELKNQFVFIVAVKPETSLIEGKNTDEIYPKIFDFIINLKPIHNEDYKSIVLMLINKNKHAIEKLTGIAITDDELPLEFEWILIGVNLTVRDLKQRLNQGLLLYEVLKNKLVNGTPAVDLKRCMAISYLENTYPKEYYDFVNNENEISKIVEFTYIIRNGAEYTNNTDTEKEKKIADKIQEIFKRNLIQKKEDSENWKKIIEVIARMLLRGIIDSDYRMYFYSYPKGSYVKDTDEKMISNLLELPYSNQIYGNLNEIISRMGEKADKTIMESYISLMNRELPLPNIIFENEKMFRIASENYIDATIKLMVGQLKWNEQNIKTTKSIFVNINNYSLKNKMELFEKYSNRVISEQIKSMQEADIYTMRLAIIESIGDNVIYCKNLFLAENLPIISSLELQSDISITKKIKLLNVSLINSNNIKDIFNVINSEKLKHDDYMDVRNICNQIISGKIPEKIYIDIFLRFIMINRKIDLAIFEKITNSYINYRMPEISNITEYLNELIIEEVPIEYLNNIDELAISDDISNGLLEKLRDNNFYHSFLLCMIKQDRLSEIQFEDKVTYDNIMKVMQKLNALDINNTIEIRKYVIRTKMEHKNRYIDLFFGDYPLITIDELKLVDNFTASIPFINFQKILAVNDATVFIEHLNRFELDQNESISFLDLFGSQITIIEVITEIFAKLDYSKIKFSKLPMDVLETFVLNANNALNLNDAQNCLKLMNEMGVLIESLENVLYIYGLSRYIISIDEYISLINRIAIPTQVTIKILSNYEIVWGLTDTITDILSESGYTEKAIIGKTLWNKAFDFGEEKVEFSIYLNLYLSNVIIFEYMVNNNDFLTYIIDNYKYKDFPSAVDITKLKPLYKCSQTIDFIYYLFETLDETQKKEYLLSFWRLKTKQDSIAFAKFMLKDENNIYLEKEADYNKIKEKLWEDAPQQKSAFTRQRNKLYPNKI